MLSRLAFLIGFTAATVTLTAGEPPKPLWTQDFEDRTAGQAPNAWSGIWGKQGDDLLVVSNLRCAGGRNAFLLDRTGDNTEMWGVSTPFPDVKSGWAHFSFAFLVQGAGHDARFGFELREAHPSSRRVVALSFGASKVRAIPMSELGGYMDSESVRLGGFEKDAWHRLDLWLPASGSTDRRGAAQLLRRVGDDPWEPVDAAQPLPLFPPSGTNAYGLFMLVANPGARGYKLFLDDLQVTPEPALPEPQVPAGKP
ncbi:MAG: hypothetical protein A3K19_10750 [Lentisphaerae bacterium RIFOXYB12_FULL_65_16]|nr:MAG: hypothetical protein A3K18_28475 [Lentisphaerae bacterium RIFOXYA12_64_32]OGV87865.1 MAG: hypothetical protein A3K19_10750 [Lentisphaerae bacterium RIFOXYB12_FULL_65_16]